MQMWMLFLPALLACIVPVLARIKRIHTGWFVLIVPILLTIYYGRHIGGAISYSKWNWIPSINIILDSRLDGLSLLFSLLISGIGVLVVLYSIFYLSKQKERLGHFYCYLLLFMTGMLGAVQADHVISLYVFWEVTSITSFLLIGYTFWKKESTFGALKSFLITMFGGFALLGGLLLLSVLFDTYSIQEMIASDVSLTPAFYIAMALVLIGAFAKSAQLPFSIWLPDAMAAPTPVSAYLHSATMVKAGIYVIARFMPIFSASDVYGWLLIGFGLATLLWGAFFALKQQDLKGILAYSTISQLGMIVALLGVAALNESSANTLYAYAAFVAFFHLCNHATFKGALFMVAGIVDHQAGTRDMKKLGGLASSMPITFTIMLLGILSMAGLPPLNGFLSKELFFTAIFSLGEWQSWGIVLSVIGWIASICTFMYSVYLLIGTFFGQKKIERSVKEASVGLLISPVVLVVLGLFIFAFPNLLGDKIVKPAVVAVQPALFENPAAIDVHIARWHGFTLELIATIVLVIVGALILSQRQKWFGYFGKWSQEGLLNTLYRKIEAIGTKRNVAVSAETKFGAFRHYFMTILIAFILLIGGTLFGQRAFNIDLEVFSTVKILPVFVALFIIAAIVLVLFAKTRLTAIIALGAVGYGVALLFILFQAPDLALTQLVIETISVALFLLAFYHLPKKSRHEERMQFRFWKVVVAGGVGLLVTLLAFSAFSQQKLDSIQSYYKETVTTEAGGGNIVNVILVDYRGFDTLFEITVLSIAAMAIIGLIQLKLSKKRRAKHETK